MLLFWCLEDVTMEIHLGEFNILHQANHIEVLMQWW